MLVPANQKRTKNQDIMEWAVDSLMDIVIVLDAQSRILNLNPAAQMAIGQSISEAIGQPAAKVLSNWPGLLGPDGQIQDTHSEIIWGENERARYFDLRISRLLDRNERVTGRLIFLRDITDRKQAEQGLQRAHEKLGKEAEKWMIELLVVNEQLRREIEVRKPTEETLQQSLKFINRAKQEWESTVDSLPQLIFLIDGQGSILRTNRTVERWHLAPLVNIQGGKIHDLFHPGCPDSGCYLEKFWLQAQQELAQGRPAECEVEDRILRRYLQIQVAPILSAKYAESEDSSNYSVVVVHDITERKRAQKEITDLEEQLRQSQKMEAIGRLAGGIAHDFNNLLTLIKGYTQLSVLELKEKDPLKDHMEGIKRASESAADLIRQLLAFSRRQVMEMKVLDLNTLLRDLDKMLRRVIGENIELVTLLTDDLGRVKADPGQIEQVILNLAVNARDAMPSGGKLTIETANAEVDGAFARAHIGVSPGRYMRLSVKDTGVGMTPEVQERIFEPFFTTKEKGKGTGLGLSTVYGIVKQSGGNIWVDSAPGQGTTFKIYLPRVEELAEELTEKVRGEDLPRGQETVLVVEDDAEVRQLSMRILNRQGYRVWQAVNGVEALRICEQQKEPIDLMLTDVVMPQMGGKELAEKVLPLRPQMKVLFTSGYLDDEIVHKILNSGNQFLKKPFSPALLARKVREVLDR
jgi:PAS domain S-box-containing protein